MAKAFWFRACENNLISHRLFELCASSFVALFLICLSQPIALGLQTLEDGSAAISKQESGFFLINRSGVMRKHQGTEVAQIRASTSKQRVASKSGFYSINSDSDCEGLSFSEDGENWRFLTNGPIQFSIYEVAFGNGGLEELSSKPRKVSRKVQTQLELTKGELILGTSSAQKNGSLLTSAEKTQEFDIRSDIVLSDPRLTLMLLSVP